MLGLACPFEVPRRARPGLTEWLPQAESASAGGSGLARPARRRSWAMGVARRLGRPRRIASPSQKKKSRKHPPLASSESRGPPGAACH